jgi:hypothetical protein
MFRMLPRIYSKSLININFYCRNVLGAVILFFNRNFHFHQLFPDIMVITVLEGYVLLSLCHIFPYASLGQFLIFKLLSC